MKKIFTKLFLLDLKWYQKLIFYIVMIDLFIFAILIMAIFKKSFQWIFLGLFVILIIIRLKLWWNNFAWKRLSSGNIFIFGPKGYGKDLLMQLSVIKRYRGWLNRNRLKYLTNIEDGYHYDYGGTWANPKDVFNLHPNTYKNLIEDNVVKLVKNDFYEGKDYYLSDASVFFPSHEDQNLKKSYPSFGLFYALSRHLYNMNIKVNTQVGGRLWIMLREQVQDGYVEALGNIGFGWFWSSLPILRKYVFIRARYYQKLESAEMGLLPFNKVAILNKVLDKSVYMTSAGATQEQYKATNGDIREFTVMMRKKDIRYDTRYFEHVFFLNI